MTYQHVTAWVFAAAALAGAVAVGAWTGPRATVKFLWGLGVYCAALAVLYIGLAAGLAAATVKVPHTGLWAPEMITAIPPTLGTVTVGSLAVWVALVTAERSRLAVQDWSEAEIFGAARTALLSLDAATAPLRSFLLGPAAAAGRDMLAGAWSVLLGGPQLGASLYGARKAVAAALPPDRRAELGRALTAAEAAASQLAAAWIRAGRPWQATDPGLAAWTVLDGDVMLLRDLLDWAGREAVDGPDGDACRARLVFLLARAAAVAAPPGDDEHAWAGLLDPHWLPGLLDRLEAQRRSGLPPMLAGEDSAELDRVSAAWDGFARARLARWRLLARLDESDPARHPSRPFAAPVHGELWDRVITGWHADLEVLAGIVLAGTVPGGQPGGQPGGPPSGQPGGQVAGPARTSRYAGVLPGTGGVFTVTVPAPPDLPVIQEARAASRDMAFLLGRLELGVTFWSGGPDEVWPEDLRLWAVTADARWHPLRPAAEVIAADGTDLTVTAPLLYAATHAATRDRAADVPWACPPPAAQARWWVAARHDDQTKRTQEQRELRPDSG